jgi:hypothetical protein
MINAGVPDADAILAGTGITSAPLESVMQGAPVPTPGGSSLGSALVAQQAQPVALSGKTVSVLNPAGKPGEVPVENIEKALAQGYKLDTPENQAVREYVDANKGMTGGARVALDSFANQALFGIPEIVFNKTGSSLEVAKHEALAKEHGFASAIGGLSGFGASLFIGGPLFKGAAKVGTLAEQAVTRGLAGRLAAEGAGEVASRGMARALVEKAAASAVKMGVEGAVIASPTAITEAALGDPEQAAETLLLGAGAGAALGVVGSGAKELFNRAVQKTGGAGIALEKYADEQALKSIDPSKRIADRLGEIKDSGKIVRELGLVRQVNEEAADLAMRAQGVKSEVGGRIDDVYKNVKSTFDGTAMATKLRADVVDPLAGKVGYAGHSKKIAAYVDDFETKYAGRPVTAEELVQVRRDLDGLIYGERMPGPEQIDKQYKAARDIFKDVLDSRVKSELGEGSLAELQKLNSQYRVASLVDKSATYNIGRTTANRTNGLTDYLMGGALSATTAAAGGGLVGGGVGQLVGMFGNKYLRSNYNSVASSAAEKLGLLFTEQSMRKAALEADRLPSVFETLAKQKGLAAGARSSPEGHLEAIFGAKDYAAISDKLTKALANPETLATEVGKISSGIADGGAPGIAKAYNAKQIDALQYLHEHLPRMPASPDPFTKPVPWTPARHEWADFSRRAETVANPYVVFDRIADGTLSSAHMQTLERIYPKLLADVKTRIAAEAAKKTPPSLDYAQRAALRLLMGSATKPVNWQADFAGQQKKPAAPKLPKTSGAIAPTDIQRITG